MYAQPLLLVARTVTCMPGFSVPRTFAFSLAAR